jgi:hypothetical protein
MRTELERQPDGCWVLWGPAPLGDPWLAAAQVWGSTPRRWGVVAEGSSRLWLAVARLWWWLQVSP